MDGQLRVGDSLKVDGSSKVDETSKVDDSSDRKIKSFDEKNIIF